MAGISCEMPRGALRSANRPIEIEPESSEVAHPFREASMGRDFQLVVEELCGFGEAITEASIPGSVRGGSEPELDEELDVGGIIMRCSGETVVVERLTVVRVGSRLEQCPREVRGCRVWWLIGFATTERASQRGERWDEAAPQEPGVRIGAGIEENPGGGDS